VSATKVAANIYDYTNNNIMATKGKCGCHAQHLWLLLDDVAIVILLGTVFSVCIFALG